MAPGEAVNRLVLPLAQLLARALNGKSEIERHNCAFYLGEAALELLGAAAVVSWDRDQAPANDPRWRQLDALARPSLGAWLAWVRSAEAEEGPFHQPARSDGERTRSRACWTERGSGWSPAGSRSPAASRYRASTSC